MSYKPDTILTRKTPFKAPKDDEPDQRPYNAVRVIGPSPVVTAARSEEWAGQQGDAYTVQPVAGFGANVDVPLGALRHDYNVESEPDDDIVPVPTQPVVRQARPGPSPEAQFSEGTATPVVPREETAEEVEKRTLTERIEALEAQLA